MRIVLSRCSSGVVAFGPITSAIGTGDRKALDIPPRKVLWRVCILRCFYADVHNGIVIVILIRCGRQSIYK